MEPTKKFKAAKFTKKKKKKPYPFQNPEFYQYILKKIESHFDFLLNKIIRKTIK